MASCALWLNISSIIFPEIYGKLSLWFSRSDCCTMPGWYPSLFKDLWRSSEVYKANVEITMLTRCEKEASNSMLFQTLVAFLGLIVWAKGYHLNADHMLPLMKYLKALPSNISEMQHLLGLEGYFRQHLKNFGVKTIVWSPQEFRYQLSNHTIIHSNLLGSRSSKTIKTGITELPILTFPDFWTTICSNCACIRQGLGWALR